MLVSGVQYRDSVFLQIILHYRSLQDNGCNSLYWTVYCLSILYIVRGRWIYYLSTVCSISASLHELLGVSWLLRITKADLNAWLLLGEVPLLRECDPPDWLMHLQFQEMPTLIISLQDGTELLNFLWEIPTMVLQSTYGLPVAFLQSSWQASHSGLENQMWTNCIW